MFLYKRYLFGIWAVFFSVFSVFAGERNAIDTNIVSYLNYVQNKGQWHHNVLYQSRFRGGEVYLENSSFTFLFYPKEGISRMHGHLPKQNNNIKASLNFHAINIAFAHALPEHTIEAQQKQDFYHNYFSGKDPAKWASNVPVYKQIIYKNIYQGIDVKTIGQGNHVRYDFIIHPLADPSSIELQLNGQDGLSIKDGNLIIQTSVGDMIQNQPLAYQIENGKIKTVSCEYELKKDGVKIKVTGSYNKQLDLIIDPTLIFATYTGSTADNFGMTATYDLSGNGYTAGIAFKVGYPVTVGAFQTSYGGSTSPLASGFDISISKFNPTGTSLMYSTYLGGGANESPQSIVVDNNNNLVVLGRTRSTDFPVTSNVFQNTLKGGSDIIITKFNAAGSALVASTFIGGLLDDGINFNEAENVLGSLKYNYADDGRGSVIVDKNNNIYVASCTIASDFPVTPGCLQSTNAGMQDGCVFKFNPALNALFFSTYLGGNQNDAAYNIALDKQNTIYVTGGTESANYPSTPGTLHPSYMGNIDGFITHLSNNGNTILESSFIGTPDYDQSYFVQLDKFNNVYLYGQSSGNYPISPGVYANNHSGQFIHEMTSNLSSTIFSTEFGSGRTVPDIAPSAFLVDNCQNIYISGWGGPLMGYNVSSSSTFGLSNTTDAFQPVTDGEDFYFLVLQKNASGMIYASYFGGSQSSEHVDGGTSRFDKAGIIYQAICESCGGHDDMPTTPGAWSSTNNSANCNNALVKFKFDVNQTVAQLSTNPLITEGCAPLTIAFINNSVHAVHYKWLFGDGGVSTAFEPTHTYDSPGTYTVTLIATDSSTCNMIDTTYTNIIVKAPFTLNPIPDIHLCKGDSATIPLNAPAGVFSFSWSPANSLNDASISNPITFPSSNITYYVLAKDSFCSAIDSVHILVHLNQTHILEDPNHVCLDDTVILSANQTYSSYQWNNGQSNSNVHITQPGLYTLTTTDTYGCRGFDSIRIGNYIHLPIIGFDTVICSGQSVTLNTLEGNYIYDWNPESSLNDPHIYNPTASPLSPTIYTITIYNGPCISTAGYSIQVLPTPTLAVTPTHTLIFPGESVSLNAQADTMCYWFPPQDLSCYVCYSPISTPDSNITYTVSVSNKYGCINSATVKIDVRPSLYIPNTFTPNGNDLNDVFRPVFSGYVKIECYIFDRWGTEIYHWNTLDGGWDGTYKGKKAQQDVYVYKLIATDYMNRTLEKVGHVTLLR